MSDSAILFGACATGFGVQVGWEIQSTNDNTASARAVALDCDGEPAAAKLHDEKQDVTTTYKAVLDANTIPVSLGAVVNSLVLTSIAISSTEGDYATMTLTGHNHTSNSHATPALKVATHG